MEPQRCKLYDLDATYIGRDVFIERSELEPMALPPAVLIANRRVYQFFMDEDDAWHYRECTSYTLPV